MSRRDWRALSTLKRRASTATAWRGHRMAWGTVAGRADGPKSLYGRCRRCGMGAVLHERPAANDVDVSGEAVALNCRMVKRGRPGGRLRQLYALGFDDSYHVAFTPSFHVRCSRCSAVCVNGIPTHEQGCPNTRRECLGCSALVRVPARWCSECAS